jgi:hypothetical protein
LKSQYWLVLAIGLIGEILHESGYGLVILLI